jgi:hypothetical protein
MKIRLFAVLAVVLAFASFGSAETSIAVNYEYAPIAFPGARVTSAVGINNSNVIVGFYYDAHDFVHGFVYRSGKYTAVNFPGATITEVLGINDYGDIVGMYQLPGNLNFHGFLRHANEFASIDDPKATIGTIAFGINKSGTIVGSYDNAHGFVYENGAFRTVDAPQLSGEPYQTQLNGINNLGWIVGQVFTAGIWRGFWIDNGKLHFIEALRSVDSEATGVDGHGDIVGCHDQQGFVSFLAGSYNSSAQSFPPQQPLASCPAAINYARAIVGSYSSVTNEKGFLAVPALTIQVSRAVLPSGALHLTATATGVNPIAQMQVWVNGRDVYQVGGASLDTTLPSGTNGKIVVQAVDSKGTIAKVANTQ